MDDFTIDTRGLKCPLVVMTVKQKIKAAKPGQRVVVLADDSDAPTDLAGYATVTGRKLEVEEIGRFVLTK